MRERKFHEGDVVAFQVALRKLQGVVTEDRGPIGMGGRHLYGVKFQFDRFAEEPSYVELPAVDMELVEPAKTKK